MTFAAANTSTDLGALTPLTVNIPELTIPGPWDVERVTSLLLGVQPPWHKINLDYFNGDHWQQGVGWTGPTPPREGSAGDFNTIMTEIMKSFVSKNCIREIVERAISGVLGHEPSWGMTVRRKLAQDETPTPEEQVLIDEAEALLTDWWDARGAFDALVDATTRALLTERGHLRFYIPHAFVNPDGSLRPGTPEQWARRLAIHSPESGQAGVFIDPNSLQEVGAYVYTDIKGMRHTEIVTLDGEGEEARTIVTEVTDTTLTLNDLASLNMNTSRTTFGEQGAFDIQGNLTIGELKMMLLVTEQVRKLQAMVNQALTMAQHNVNLGGFLERVILNGQYPGHFEDVAGATGSDGKPRRKWVRDSYEVGAGAVNFITGLPTYDPITGSLTGYTNPSIIYRDPVDPTTFMSTVHMAYRAILEEVQQIHALVAGDQYPSGESRRQARADFETWLRKIKRPLNKTGRWQIETALALIAFCSGQAGRYASLRATFSCRVDPGPATAESIRAGIELNQADGLSNENMMVWGGVEDPDAERAKINTEKEAGIVPVQPRAAGQIPLDQNNQRREGSGAQA
jgi:hypothetical protein